MTRVRLPGWRAALATATLGLTFGASALLVACGGGGNGDGSPAVLQPTETATSYTQGVITGFGSVIVGGVRYDDDRAAVTNDDGVVQDRGVLRLGMTVQVDGAGLDRTAGTGRALRIRFGGEVLGPVGSIDTTASTVQVLGQTVLVTTSTVFDSTLSGGLSALTAGAVVEVHGIPDSTTGRIVATRIESETGATAYRLRGTVSALDTTARTFRIGTELISYANIAAADLPATLADGQIVGVRLETTQLAGAWVATALRGAARGPDSARPDAHVEGVITSLTSTTRFVLNGLTVDATNATFPDGSTGIVVGARVEVEGAVSNGVLVASKVEIQDRRAGGQRPLELHGLLANLDGSAKTFALRGVTVWYGGTVVYRNGAEADLANGRRVQVRGVLSSDRTRVEAARIEFE